MGIYSPTRVIFHGSNVATYKNYDDCSLTKNPACHYVATGELSIAHPITKENVNKPIGLDPITRNPNYPLGLAARSGDHVKYSYLIKLGADPGLLKYDTTALYEQFVRRVCPFEPSSDSIESNIYQYDALQQSGILPDYQRLLFTSARYGCVSTAQYALNHGADVNARNEQGFTPLHLTGNSATKQKAETIKFLISQGADTTIKSKNGDTAYEQAKKVLSTTGNWHLMEEAFLSKSREQ